MFFRWLKRYTPKGLYGRAALILIVPLTVLLAIISIIFIQRHYEDVTRQMTRVLAIEVQMIMDAIEAAPDADAAMAAATELAEPLRIDLTLPSAEHPEETRLEWADLSGRQIVGVLSRRQNTLLSMDLLTEPRDVTFWMDSRYGVVEMTVERRRVSPSNPHQFLLLMLLVALIMAFISLLFLRNQLRPIRRLSRAAEAFGRGQVVPYAPTGAVEVRSAGNAFLDMRARIERQIEQRTLMLSGVSHDLRTPLTRMKLGLSMLEDSESAEDLRRDVEDMERLLEEFLAFARGDALDDPEEVDLSALLKETVERFPGARGRITLKSDTQPSSLALVRPMAIGRAVSNLVSNSMRYANHASVALRMTGKSVTISVEDDGPGIPKADREEALKPFVRLDSSRNQDKGSGVGLGLAIAHDIARRHGGTLRLGTSETLGGLKAEIVIPR